MQQAGYLFPDSSELQVIKILEDLHQLITKAETPFYALRWGGRKRRSVEEQGIAVRSRSNPSLQTNHDEESEEKALSTSPTTPLSFSPSDAEYRSRRPRKSASKTKSVKELMEQVTNLSTVQEQLKHEICQYRELMGELKEKNMELKSKHDKARKLCRLDLNTFDPPQRDADSGATTQRDLVSRLDGSPQSCSRSEKTGVAILLPDLNCVAEEALEETVPLDLCVSASTRMAMAAQARKRRMEINREKAAFKLPRWR